MRANRARLWSDIGSPYEAAGLGCWSRVLCASWVMRIQRLRNLRLPATLLLRWVRRRQSTRSTSCWDEHGPAVSPNGR